VTDVKVPAAPALATIPNVELMHTGTWPISTGVATFTTADLAAAVAALDCPAVRRPVLKLGHAEPDPDEAGMRWDGEPAVGWIANMAVAEQGRTLVGDYAGMPAWLGQVVASAYPDRSIEGMHGFRCQMGHVHDFVITAVALLGVTAPGIGTLQSLQDVAELYGVAAAEGADPSGDPVTITVRAAQEDRVPNTQQVAAGVTTEDVRRAFYSSDYGKGWDKWIEEMQLGPDVQLIVMDDASGTRARVPVTIGDGDGEDAVTFAEPVAVVVRYEDAPKVAAAAGARWVAWASKAESRPDAPGEPGDSNPPVDDTSTTTEGAASVQPPPEQTPVTDPVSGPTTKERLNEMEFSDEQLAALRAKLGLPEDATLDPTALVDGIEKLTASSGDGSPGKTTHKNTPGTVTVDQQVWDDMQTRINRLEQIRASQERSNRERAVDDAIAAGKFAPSRREHWLRVYEADPEGTTNLLAGLTPGQVPTSDYGMPGVGDGPDSLDAEFAHIFPAERNGA
jgi:hypothetical protein